MTPGVGELGSKLSCRVLHSGHPRSLRRRALLPSLSDTQLHTWHCVDWAGDWEARLGLKGVWGEMTGRSWPGILVPPARSFLDTCCLMHSGHFGMVTDQKSGLLPNPYGVGLLSPKVPPSPQADVSVLFCFTTTSGWRDWRVVTNVRGIALSGSEEVEWKSGRSTKQGCSPSWMNSKVVQWCEVVKCHLATGGKLGTNAGYVSHCVTLDKFQNLSEPSFLILKMGK